MEEINKLFTQYSEASKKLTDALALAFGEVDFNASDYSKIPKELKGKQDNIEFRYNKKITVNGVIVGVVKKTHKIRVFNSKSKKMYFIDCSDVIMVYN